jgi:cytochrome c oxidase cbb3-type subunit 1
MWSSGITEGAMWRAIDDGGKLMYPDWVAITEVLKPFRLARAIGGTFYLTGVIIGVYNLTKTILTPAPHGGQAAA